MKITRNYRINIENCDKNSRKKLIMGVISFIAH